MNGRLDRLEAAFLAAEKLLKGDEKALPKGVKTTIRFLEEHDLWYHLSRNRPVTSCREAASSRQRLGYIGIPLSDELKSYLAEVRQADCKKKLLLIHCRGNQVFDFEKVSNLEDQAHEAVEKADVREITDFEMGYGLINPFTVDAMIGREHELTQIFDESVVHNLGEAATMMTNAGDRTWGVEFDPRELAAHRLRADFHIADISTEAESYSPELSVGILTGNAPESGALLWNWINAKSRQAQGEEYRGDISNPRVVVSSAPFLGWTMELSTRDHFIEERVLGEIDLLQGAGVERIGIACNTTQYYADRINERLRASKTTFVPLPSVVYDWVSKQNEPINIVGIDHVVSPGPWSAFNAVQSLPNVILPNERQIEVITKLAYLVKAEGVTPRAYQMFRSIIRASPTTKVLLLLTEMSLVFWDYRKRDILGADIVDSMELYAERLIAK